MSASYPTNPLTAAVANTWPTDEWRHVHVLVAVSGGADSVALLRALAAMKQHAGDDISMGGRLFVAHYNHRLRGAASDADADWVAALAEGLGLACEIGLPDSKPEDPSEEAARDARYAFLRTAAERLGARFVATAHTADDQIETVLMRIVRGTGIAGLVGVPPRRSLSGAVTLVRPLLSVTRAEVLASLDELGQPFREDATNRDRRYTRNRVRHELLPLIRESFGHDVDASLLGLAGQAAEAQAVIESLAQALVAEAITSNNGANGQATGFAIDRRATRDAAPLVVAETVKLAWRRAGWPEQAMGRQQWRRIVRLVATEEGPAACDLPGGVRAARTGRRVTLTRGGC